MEYYKLNSNDSYNLWLELLRKQMSKENNCRINWKDFWLRRLCKQKLFIFFFKNQNFEINSNISKLIDYLDKYISINNNCFNSKKHSATKRILSKLNKRISFSSK